MVVPLPEIEKRGGIIIPQVARKQLNEGHIIALGPLCQAKLEEGDCITWDEHAESLLDIDGVKFVLVNESQVCMRIPKAELEAAYAAEIGIKVAPRHIYPVTSAAHPEDEEEMPAHSSAPERELPPLSKHKP